MTIVKHSLFGPGCLSLALIVLLGGCAPVKAPDARNVDVPTPASADVRRAALNERPDSVMYLPLGDDVLVPEIMNDDPLPSEKVGPFELRGETLAGALQLILAEYDISMAFETDLAFSRYVTVANLHGDLDKVVRRVCSLANLYCSYEDGTLVIKETQTFTITLPPISGNNASGGGEVSAGSTDSSSFVTNVAAGLAAVLGGTSAGAAGAPIVDQSTRTIIYSATQRTAELASRYFQRLRANTAMVVFETYIWEVNLNAGNSTGVDWDQIGSLGKYNSSINVIGAVAGDFTNPVSIGLPTTQDVGAAPSDIVRFLSRFGAVKSISQPQITVLSGSTAQLRVAETENFVSEITTTISEGQSSTAVSTDSVDSGFTLTIGSTWDKATVYANIGIELTNVLEIQPFAFSDGGDEGTTTSIQLPQTTERQLSTQVRMRPGDSVLIAGLVQENDNFNTRGPGLMEPILPDSRTALTENLELVFLLRPRVIVYTPANATPPHSKAAVVSSATPAEKYKPAPRQSALSENMSAGPDTTMPSAPAPAPVTSAPVTAAPVPVTPVAPTPSSYSGSARTSSPRTSSSSYEAQAPYNTRGSNSGYVSKYLSPTTGSVTAPPSDDMTSLPSGTTPSVEIYDPGAASGSIGGASQPVPLSGYSTYGAEGGY